MLASAIDGQSAFFGCDMLQILYDSDVKDGYYTGVRDQVTNGGGYLLSLVHMGVIVESTFASLKTGDTGAWTAVQAEFGGTLAAAAKNVQAWD